LLEELAKLDSNYEFTIETHLNNINSSLAENFNAARIKWVKFGIESAIDNVKADVSRYSLSNDEQYKRIELLRNNKIKTVAMYIMCQPEDTYETHSETINYAKQLKTNLAQFSIFTPYPGTPYYNKNTDLINENNFEKFNQYNLVFKHRIFNKLSAKQELGRAYSAYYLDKIKIW
jgi:anaerobic magnesium-protoporphyrin IX monomethyl ester cyclase